MPQIRSPVASAIAAELPRSAGDVRAGWRSWPRSHPDAAAILVLIASFVCCTLFFFGILNQVDIDLGRDFAAADLLLDGKVLYRDVAYFYGPVAPWLHYVLFRFFGASTSVLLAAGSLAGLAIVLVTFGLARQLLSTPGAVVASLIVLANAVYGPHLMSYATPHTFAATYGLLLALLTLWSAARSLHNPISRWDLVAGVSAGLALVTRHDFAVISLLVLLLQFLFRLRRHPLRGLAAASLQAAAGAACAAPFVAVMLQRLTREEILTLIYPKQFLAVTSYFYSRTYFWGAASWTGLSETTTGFLLSVGYVVAATVLATLLVAFVRGQRSPATVAVLFALAAIPFLWEHRYLGYYPLLLHAGVLVLLATRRVPDRGPTTAFLTLAAAAFLFRVALAPSIRHILYALLYFIPSLIVFLYLCNALVSYALSRWAPLSLSRAVLHAVLLVSFVLYPLARTSLPWSRRVETIATERGVLRVGAQEAPKVRLVLDQIRRHSSPGDPILLIPHGTMYYFLSGRRPASRYLDYSPGQLLDGEPEAEETRQLARTPPKLVILDDISYTFFFPGPVNRFGYAYNQRLREWIQQNYCEISVAEHYGRPLRFFVPIRSAS